VRIRGKSLYQLWHSLMFTVLRSYGIVLVAFALLVGIIFINLYSDVTMDSYRNQLRRRAESIAARVSEFVQDDFYGTYPSYLEVLEELETADIWIIQNPDNPMDVRYINAKITAEQEIEMEPVLKKVFQGEIGYMTEYTEMYGANYVFVGAPIVDLEGHVVGAVLVNSLAESQKQIMDQSYNLILASVVLGLAISIAIAFWLARQISRPISRMRYVAMELANENYDIDTELNRADEIGELAGAIDVLADRLKETEEARRNMEQMRQDFFANVSHELRTPITVMRAYTESLVDGIVTDETKVHQYYERMLSECKSMERLVGDLLVLSKMQNPEFEVEKEPINLLQIFDDILRGDKTTADQKNIRILLECEGLDEAEDGEKVCLMLGDYDRIRQMFLVILDNAIKFSPEGGQVEIRVQADESQIRVAIVDHGVGISEEELPQIFDKFYKSKLRQNAKGSGLGLAIAREIARKHEGTIRVSSRLGEGTCFHFTFKKLKTDFL